MEIQELLPIGAAIVSFIVAAGFAAWVSKQQAGTKEMVDISNAVKTGASAFLKREMKIIIPIAIALAFRGGATVGLAVPAMALLAITLLYLVYPNPITIAGVGIGASLIALFIRIGGGIFTKAADMAA